MNLRDDVTRIEIVHTDALPWDPSPSPTVWRKRLELSGPTEAGRVTSVVRYDPNSRFAAHPHPGGEEILVLQGVFSDERGDYPAGSYLLNPEGFEHAPFSRGGCVLFVKLRQYPGVDRPEVAIDTRATPFTPGPYPGVDVLPLYRQDGYPEEIRLVRLAARAEVPLQRFPAGEEIFVLEGDLADEHGSYREGTWVRYPPGAAHTPRTERGATFYVKKGHLAARAG